MQIFCGYIKFILLALTTRLFVEANLGYRNGGGGNRSKPSGFSGGIQDGFGAVSGILGGHRIDASAELG